MTTLLVSIISALLVLLLVLWGIYLAFKGRFLTRLARHATFSKTPHSSQWDVNFSFASADDDDLRVLRETYKLGDIAGRGSGQERAIRLMNWVHGLTRHAVNPSTPKDLSALNLIRLCQQQGKRINCWMYSMILNECLLSVGIASRMVHLNPPTESPKESHFVVAAYLSDVQKWIMLDPDMRSFFVDERGDVLGAADVRERLISGEFLGVSTELDLQGANRLPLSLRTALYKTYISKNIFRITCLQRSAVKKRLDVGTRISYELIPDGYHPEWLKQPRLSTNGNVLVYINDAEQFWQVPSIESS